MLLKFDLANSDFGGFLLFSRKLHQGKTDAEYCPQFVERRQRSSRIYKRRNVHMKFVWVLMLSILAGFALPARARAQDKRFESPSPTALEKTLYEVELKWMKAEHDKIMDGPDSMNEMWMDDFFDVLPTGV